MTSHTTKGMLAARALAITIALLGVTVGPGGVASATATRRLTARDMAPSETLTSASRLGDRGAGAWDDDSGDGGEEDDGGDDEGDD